MNHVRARVLQIVSPMGKPIEVDLCRTQLIIIPQVIFSGFFGSLLTREQFNALLKTPQEAFKLTKRIPTLLLFFLLPNRTSWLSIGQQIFKSNWMRWKESSLYGWAGLCASFTGELFGHYLARLAGFPSLVCRFTERASVGQDENWILVRLNACQLRTEFHFNATFVVVGQLNLLHQWLVLPWKFPLSPLTTKKKKNSREEATRAWPTCLVAPLSVEPKSLFRSDKFEQTCGCQASRSSALLTATLISSFSLLVVEASQRWLPVPVWAMPGHAFLSSIIPARPRPLPSHDKLNLARAILFVSLKASSWPNWSLAPWWIWRVESVSPRARSRVVKWLMQWKLRQGILLSPFGAPSKPEAEEISTRPR